MTKITVLIPVRNENEGIGEVIEKAKKSNPVISNVIVIEGKSKDGTKEIAEDLCAEIFPGEGQGKGRDFRLFLEQHGLDDSDIYVMIDGDGTYDLKDMEDMIAPINNNEADVVMGWRSKKLMEKGAMRRCRYFGNILLTFIAILSYWKLDLKDLCTGYWAFSKEALRNVTITAEGFDLEANLFSYFVKNDYRINHVPIHYGRRKKNLYLFSMDEELETELNKGIIPESLNNMFKTKNITLSENIRSRKRKNNKWVIKDKEKGQIYSVKTEGGKLNIYEDSKSKLKCLRDGWKIFSRLVKYRFQR